jgi:deoxycytidylate deaminase
VSHIFRELQMAESLPIGSLNLGTTNRSSKQTLGSSNGNREKMAKDELLANGNSGKNVVSTNGSLGHSAEDHSPQAANGSGQIVGATNGIAGHALEDEPRQGYLDWDEYFMAVSFLSAQRSKDPATQVPV